MQVIEGRAPEGRNHVQSNQREKMQPKPKGLKLVERHGTIKHKVSIKNVRKRGKTFGSAQKASIRSRVRWRGGSCA